MAVDQQPTPAKRGYRGNHDGVSNAVIFHAIEELKEGLDDVKGTVNDLTKRFDALPESFTPRREATEINERIKDRQEDHAARIAELEKWRLVQMERQHQAEIAAMQQVNQVATVTTAQVQQVATSTSTQVAGVRGYADARIIALLSAGLVGLATTVLGYILGHIIH